MSRYNGWTNHATWCIKLWLDNDEGSQNYWEEATQGIWKECSTDSGDVDADDEPIMEGDSSAARCKLADRLKGEMRDGIPEDLSGLYLDLLTSAVDCADYYELANSFLENTTDITGYEPMEVYTEA